MSGDAAHPASLRRLLPARWRVGAVLALAIVLALGFGVPSAHAATAKQLADQLSAIRKQVQAAGSAYDKSLTRYETTGDRIQDTTRAIASESEKLKVAESVLAVRADAMYRNNPADGSIAFMLGAESFEDLISRITYIELITKSDSELVSATKTFRISLTNKRARLTTDQVAQKSQLADAKSKLRTVQSQLNAKQAEYQRVLAAFNAQLAREKAAGKVTWLPKTANGWVFPVQGAHYYSDTWGAPRSGGRRHKGTDVMSPKGTPCVAITSGTVSSSTGGLGGKTIWLRGDNGWTYYYAHLDSFVVTSGHVSAGQLIGRVGNTGNASGGADHLHFEIHPGGGSAVDPYPFLRNCE